MGNYRQITNQNESYKERFEFKLFVNDNIICQRYFKIDNFNENSLHSLELLDEVKNCVDKIKTDLVSKSRVYMWYAAPNVFKDEEELRGWLKNPNNTHNLPEYAELIIVNKNQPDYYWENEDIHPYKDKVKDSEFVMPLVAGNAVFKFSFIVGGNEVISECWDSSVYPKYIRNTVDLYNKKGRFENINPTQLNTEDSLLYKVNNEREDLTYNIIKRLSTICSYKNVTNKIEFYDDKTKKSVTYNLKSPMEDFSSKMEKIYRRKTEEYFKFLNN